VPEVVFPDIPLYQGWTAPLRIESDLKDLELVQGSVPKDLNGTLYRCGPDRQYPSMYKDDVFIDGEGMAVMFRFTDGHVDFKSRWVRNERFKLQEEARRSLFGRYRNRYTDDPSVAGKDRGTSNTNMLFHAGKLLSLKEDHLPFEMDPDTLESIAPYDYDGQVTAVSMTAHPKIDLVTSDLFTYSYQAKGDGTTDFVFYLIGPDGQIKQETWFNAPYAGMVHDFGITETHIVVPFYPLITDVEVLKQGGPYYQWHEDQPTVYAVLPRGGTSADIRWFKGPALSAGHVMNAWNDGTKIHFDTCLYTGNCFSFFPRPDGTETDPVPPILTRVTFDLARNDDGFDLKPICPVPGEMPRTDDRYQGRPYRHGWMLCRSPDGSAGIGQIDVQTGAFKMWKPGPEMSVQEPQFVPRTPASPEGDGYLLVIVNRLAEGRCDLAILDAQKIEAGPVATLKLPVRIRMTFHGMWVPEETFKTGLYDMTVAA
jgi:carotenoid cleavage dioxygenase